MFRPIDEEERTHRICYNMIFNPSTKLMFHLARIYFNYIHPIHGMSAPFFSLLFNSDYIYHISLCLWFMQLTLFTILSSPLPTHTKYLKICQVSNKIFVTIPSSFLLIHLPSVICILKPLSCLKTYL